MKSRLRTVRYDGVAVSALMFVCPGCVEGGPDGYDGIHMLPVNVKDPNFDRPSWDWDGNLEAPTLSPSILSNKDNRTPDGQERLLNEDGTPRFPRCHSYLKAGVFEFLNDCEHALGGHKVPIPDLPEWAINLS